MHTWKLWRELQYPNKQHPLFRYFMRKKPISQSKSLSALWRGFILFGAIALCSIFSSWIIVFIIGLILLAPILFAIGHSTIYGIIWSGHIAETIATLHRHNIYDLLAITPKKASYIHTTVAKATLYSQNFDTVSSTVKTLLRFTLISITIVLAFHLFALLTPQNLWSLGLYQERTLLIIAVYPFIGYIYLDHIQSTLMAMLIGIRVAINRENSITTRITAMSAFLTVQLMMYALTNITILLIIQFIARQSGSLSLSAFILLWLTIGVFVHLLMRETIIHLLWQTIERQLN